ncbi:MAG: hypothetical protein HYR73_07030 [Candidatus Eisenbacteria bacterium]|nr:hypothetical protein [Candidatus Eisenbacteria bacterium]
MDKAKEVADDKATPFERLAGFLTRILQVSKDEIAEHDARKRRKPQKPKGRQSS